jgi:hypothetical protein
MKRRFAAAALAAGCLSPAVARATEAASPVITAPLGTTISYQGKLDKNGSPVNGNCNFIFGLFNAASGGTQVGTNLTLSNQPVTAGVFSLGLDFGAGAFDGQARWLNIQVQGPGDAGYTTLTPRQPITAAPYAVYALGGPATGSQWSNDTNGINYGGKVGIGTPSSGSIRLHIDAGSTDMNAIYAHNSNSSWATLVTRNFAAGGFGLYDDSSSRHYLFGRVGLGVATPEGKLHASASSETAVMGVSSSGFGVLGRSNISIGVFAESTSNDGVLGISSGTGKSGIAGVSHHPNGQGGYFANDAGGNALVVVGRAVVHTLQIVGGSDLAEPFDVGHTGGVEPAPGSVVVIDPDHPGRLMLSDRPYDRRVAGIISGANGLAAGMVLESESDPLASGAHPVAMTGRVWCWADASAGAIVPGDRLTTSEIPGHAMRADDWKAASGAVIGKAITGLASGRGLVLVLVNLQ